MGVLDIPVLLVITIGAYILLFIGLSHPSLRILKNAAGFMLMAISVVIIQSGIESINNILTEGIAFINIGVGFYFLIHDSFSRDDQAESYDQFHEEVE